jgi:hypothetical protein
MQKYFEYPIYNSEIIEYIIHARGGNLRIRRNTLS